MKRNWIFLLVFCGFFVAKAQKTNVLLNYQGYCTEDQQPYIEFLFAVDGSSVVYTANENGKYEAEVDMRVDIERHDTLLKSLHFVLLSAEFGDTVRTGKPDFTTVKNVPMPQGEYVLHFYVKDLHSSAKTMEYIDNITLYFPQDKVAASDAVLLSELHGEDEGRGFYEKYGYSMTPLLYGFVPEKMPVLPYAMEVYNTDKILGKDGYFLVRSYIEVYENGLLGNGQHVCYTKRKTAPVVVLLDQLDVFKLYSGNYNAVIEILDADSNVLVTTKSFFQRSNPSLVLSLEEYNDVQVSNTFMDKLTDTLQLREYVSYLYPISSSVECEFYNKRMSHISFDRLKKFFYSFWMKRNSKDPEGEWLRYKAKVEYVNKAYGSKVVKGYRTDRGRVYLQYGPPTQIIEEPYDPQAYPYEVWTYYVLGAQTNVKFIFYAPDPVSNEYQLLHSDAQGEVRNTRWQMELTKRLSPSINPDDTQPSDYWGGDMNNNYRLNR